MSEVFDVDASDLYWLIQLDSSGVKLEANDASLWMALLLMLNWVSVDMVNVSSVFAILLSLFWSLPGGVFVKLYCKLDLSHIY